MDLDNEELYFTKRHNEIITDEDVKKAIEALNYILYKPFSSYDKLYFEDDTNIMVFEAIETILNELKYKEKKIKELEENYIPKSLVREKIKEYKWASEDYDSDVADYGQSQAIGAYIALIELLQEGDK